MGRTKTEYNKEEKFENGNIYQFAGKNNKIKANVFGILQGRSGAKAEKDNDYYTTTRLSMNGKDEYGNPYYKREVILFKSKDDLKEFEQLGSLRE